MPHAKLKGACRMECRYIEPVEEVLGTTTALNCVNMSRSSSVRSTCSISTLSPRICGGVSMTAGVRIISAAILRLAYPDQLSGVIGDPWNSRGGQPVYRPDLCRQPDPNGSHRWAFSAWARKERVKSLR